MNDLVLWLIFSCFFWFGWAAASWWVTRKHREAVGVLIRELENERTRPETMR